MSAARAVVAVVALVLVGCAETTPAPGSSATLPAVEGPVAVVSTPLIALLPSATDAVLGIDLARLREASFTRAMLTPAPDEDAATAAARRQRGFDEVADVDLVVFARLGTAGGERASLELVRGRFVENRVREAFLRNHPDAHAIAFGARAGLHTAAHALAFVDEQRLLFGPPWAVRETMKVAEGRSASARMAPWLHAASAGITRIMGKTAGPTAIELYVRGTPATRSELGEALGAELPIDHLGARLAFGSDARARFMATALDEGQAELLSERLRTALIDLRERPSIVALGLGPVVGRAELVTHGREVGLGFQVTGRERERVAERLATLAAVLAKQRAEASAAKP